jgi:hypothetical protein
MGQLILSMGPVGAEVGILAQSTTTPNKRFFLLGFFSPNMCLSLAVHAVNCLCLKYIFLL